jgi:hypothetical protein
MAICLRSLFIINWPGLLVLWGETGKGAKNGRASFCLPGLASKKYLPGISRQKKK